MAYDFKSSLEKVFNYISLIAKEPVIIKVGEKEIVLKNNTPRDLIKISDSYFRDYSCMKFPDCVKCCNKTKFWNIFTLKQFDDLGKEGANLPGEKKTIGVCGKDYEIYVEDHTVDECAHQVNGCDIHSNNPLHCLLPLIKFKKVKERLHISKEIFGRNWQFGCPISLDVFEEIKPENYYYRCIRPLEKVKEFAEQFNIDTHIDSMIEEVGEKYKLRCRKTQNIQEFF